MMMWKKSAIFLPLLATLMLLLPATSANAKCDKLCMAKCDATWWRNPNLANAQACYAKWAIINQNHAEAVRTEKRNTQTWNQLDSQEKSRRQQRVGR